MLNFKTVTIALSLCFAFAAGAAVGKETKQAKYITHDEMKWVELMPVLKVAVLNGDKDKGPYTGLFTLTNGVEAPWHSHSGDYEAVEIQGTTKHWVKGEDGAKAKRMIPGSYWYMPGGVDHITACEKGPDCVMVIWQKSKFDSRPGKDNKGAGPAAAPVAPLTNGASPVTASAVSATPAQPSAPTR